MIFDLWMLRDPLGLPPPFTDEDAVAQKEEKTYPPSWPKLELEQSPLKDGASSTWE